MIRNDIIIGTGWYSDNKRKHHLNQTASKKPYYENWFPDYWQPQIEKYLIPRKYICYSCLCDNLPNFYFDKWELILASEQTIGLPHRYNYHAALLMGAVYAYSNSTSYLWIEQDTLIHGLDKALEIAKDKKICYGFSDKCTFKDGWAAQSFIYVGNDYLPTFINKLTESRIHESRFPVPEMIFHDLFKQDATDWNTGYDRKPITDWSLPFFYAQQITDIEIDKLIKLQNN